MNKQNTEQLKKEFEEKFGGIRKVTNYDDLYTYQNMTDKTHEVWNFFLPHLISSDEIKREAVEDFARWLVPEGQGPLHISSPRGVKALISKYWYEKTLTQSKEGGE